MISFKKAVFGLVAAFAISTGAQAAVLTDNLGEFNFDGEPPFPTAAQIVGTFNFVIPAGDTVVSATLEGTFGNSVNSSSAPFDIFGDGVFIGQCLAVDPCFTGPATPFNFAVTNLGDLADGALVLSVVQTAQSVIRLGATTLTVNTRPVNAIPLPAALPLLAGGLGLMGFVSRRKKQETAA